MAKNKREPDRARGRELLRELPARAARDRERSRRVPARSAATIPIWTASLDREPCPSPRHLRVPPISSTPPPETFEQKIVRLFGDRIVDKVLAQQEAFARLPRYVSEYLIAKYVKKETAAHGPGAHQREQVRERIPDADRRELIKDRLVREGQFVLIDTVEVREDLKTGQRFATVPAIDERAARIEESILQRKPGPADRRHCGGRVKLWYRPEVDAERPVEIGAFTPFQADVSLGG
jgi:ATP-dependent Lon protease